MLLPLILTHQDGHIIYLMAHQIELFRAVHEKERPKYGKAQTLIFPPGDKDAHFPVRETPDEILRQFPGD